MTGMSIVSLNRGRLGRDPVPRLSALAVILRLVGAPCPQLPTGVGALSHLLRIRCKSSGHATRLLRDATDARQLAVPK
jgi:hypothetical protein